MYTFEDYEIGNPFSLSDLVLYYFGRENAIPGRKYGPAVTDHYVFHFATKGQGIFQSNGHSFHITEGMGFVMFPEQVVGYIVDDRNPWSISWVAFRGKHASYIVENLGITPEYPIFKNWDKDEVNKTIDLLFTHNNNSSFTEILACQSLLYSLLYHLLTCCSFDPMEVCDEDVPVNIRHAYDAVKYIKANYHMNDLSVDNVSSALSLNRSYLSKIFHQVFGISPSEYITKIRMERAYNLITDTDLPIKTIAHSVGYKDPYYFSRVFKKIHKTSPLALRKNSGNIK